MNQSAAEVHSRLKRALTKGPLDQTLLNVVLEDPQIQELVGEYLEGQLGDQEEGWSVLKEATKSRLQFAKNVISAVKDEEAGRPPHSENLAVNEANPDEPKEGGAVIDELVYHGSFVGPKSKVVLKAILGLFRWEADQDPKVVRFRGQMLAGRMLTVSDARNFMGSYAARFFPLEWFSHWNVPVVDHASRIVGEYDWGSHRDDLDHRVTVQVDDPGLIERVRYAHPDTPVWDEDKDLVSTLCVLTEDGAVIPPYSVPLPERVERPEDVVEVELVEGPKQRPVLLAPLVLSNNFQTPSCPSCVWPGSVMDALYACARELADTFPWLSIESAAQFILTGSAPRVGSLDARLYSKGGRLSNECWRINLDIFPWTAVEDVALAYKRMQQRVIEGRNRLPGSKTFEVAHFVWKQDRLNGYERLPWPDLCNRWNAGHPRLKFEKWRSFRASAERGESAVRELIDR